MTNKIKWTDKTSAIAACLSATAAFLSFIVFVLISNIANELQDDTLKISLIQSMAGSHEYKLSTIRAIINELGYEEAFELVKDFRSGASVKAVKKYILEEAEKVSNKEEIRKIENWLKNVPTVLFVDSNETQTVYCQHSQYLSGRSNIDDLRYQLRDEFIRIEKALSDDRLPEVPRWDSVLERVEKVKPTLIVFHASAFGRRHSWYEFVEKARELSPPSRLLMYSRGTATGLSAEKALDETFSFIQLQPKCISDEVNAERIMIGIRHLVQEN